MTKTVTSLFHNGQHAATAARRLEQAGIPKAGIDIWSAPINLAPVLEDAGVSRTDAHAYVEGVRNGGSVVIVSCADDDVDGVVHILDDEGMLDLDEQQASSPNEGGEEPAQELTGTVAEFPQKAGKGAPESHEGSRNRVRIQSREEERPAKE